MSPSAAFFIFLFAVLPRRLHVMYHVEFRFASLPPSVSDWYDSLEPAS